MQVQGGQQAVTTKMVQEVDDILVTECPRSAEQFQQLSVKQLQLDGRLKVLSDIDKEILAK